MPAHVDYYVSLNSPWTHLGAARLMAMVSESGATLRVFPVDFGTVFAATGGLPLPKRSPQRQAYRMQELARWRDHLGIPIHLQPRYFPSREAIPALCVVVARETLGDPQAISLAHRVLEALWEEEADPADPATLARLIADCGMDPAGLTEAAQDPRWAGRRTADTQAALDRGVFGAPAYVVGDEVFWGQDRLDFLRRRLQGA